MLNDDIAFGEPESRTEEFLFELAGQVTQQINKVVIYNEGQGGRNLYSKDFQVLIATERSDDESFRKIVSMSTWKSFEYRFRPPSPSSRAL